MFSSARGLPLEIASSGHDPVEVRGVPRGAVAPPGGRRLRGWSVGLRGKRRAWCAVDPGERMGKFNVGGATGMRFHVCGAECREAAIRANPEVGPAVPGGCAETIAGVPGPRPPPLPVPPPPDASASIPLQVLLERRLLLRVSPPDDGSTIRTLPAAGVPDPNAAPGVPGSGGGRVHRRAPRRMIRNLPHGSEGRNMRNRVLSIGFLLGAPLVGSVSAQGPEIAFGPWVGLVVNNIGGPPCLPQDCATYTYNLTTSPVSAVDIDVLGDSGQPFVLAMAPSANLCVTIPGISNSLMLTGPISVLALGTMPAGPGVTTCSGGSPNPPGRFTLTIPLPPAFVCPPGFEVDLQALVWNSTSFAFTCTVKVIC